MDGHVNPDQVSTDRSTAQAKRQMRLIESAVTKKEKKDLRTQYGIKEINNPLLDLPLDMFK